MTKAYFYTDNSKMDKVILRNKYIECAKLLASGDLPDNLPDILRDVIDNTKLFTDKLKSNKRKEKLRLVRKQKRVSLENDVNEGRHVKTSESAVLQTISCRSTVVMTSYNVRELTPRVRLTRLAVQNESGLIKDRIQQEIQKKAQSETSEIENMKTPSKRLKKFHDVADKPVNLFSRGLSDGCKIS